MEKTNDMSLEEQIDNPLEWYSLVNPKGDPDPDNKDIPRFVKRIAHDPKTDIVYFPVIDETLHTMLLLYCALHNEGFSMLDGHLYVPRTVIEAAYPEMLPLIDVFEQRFRE